MLSVGAVVCLAIGAGFAALGPVTPPWRSVRPYHVARLLGLAATALPRVVVANLSLARRIWAPSRPLTSGIVIVPTRAQTDGGLCTVGLVSSLIVDNQVIDVDRSRHQLLYHAVAVPPGGRRERYEAMNGPVERWVVPIERNEHA